ncbi:MAG TPA: Ig-like domain-containing protein, partial [Pirellula sp.]|nr:Ig-like domain-containing protein [Pirellula sp.]
MMNKKWMTTSLGAALLVSTLTPLAPVNVEASQVRAATIDLGSTYAYGGKLVLPKTYKSEPIRWYKSGFNAKLINQPQVLKGFTVKSKKPVVIKVTVDNYPVKFINSMIKVDVEKGETAALPARLKATFANGGTYFVDVKWGSVDTSKEGVQMVNGTFTRNKTTISVKAQVTVKPMTTFKLNIMHTNDTHGRVEMFPKRMTAIKEY